ncbi:hypothetical protein D3C87_2018840 [compost metagenome]
MVRASDQVASTDRLARHHHGKAQRSRQLDRVLTTHERGFGDTVAQTLAEKHSARIVGLGQNNKELVTTVPSW